VAWLTHVVPPAERVSRRAAHFTVYCLNVLTQKFATSDQYQYCPSWALAWDYRKNLILQDILQQSADIVCLQVGAPPLVSCALAPENAH